MDAIGGAGILSYRTYSKRRRTAWSTGRGLYLIAPLAVILMAALLYAIDSHHFTHDAPDQRVEYKQASEQLLDTISAFPNFDTQSEKVQLGLLNSIAARQDVECAALVFPGGTRLESGRSKTMCARTADTAEATVTSRNGYTLSVQLNRHLRVWSVGPILRLVLEALLCGLSLTLALNGLFHNAYVKRELGIRFQAQKRAQRARAVAEQVATEAEAHSKAKSDFLATMSHEIRTPLNGIVGMASLLSDSLRDETKRGYAQMISTSGHALLAILNDALDLSKIDAGKLTMHPETCDLKLSITEAVDLFKVRAGEKGIDLVCVLDDSLPAYVNVDPMRLRQMLTNLISNAVKFTDHGGVVLSANTVSGPADSDHANICIEVTDTGTGIANNNIGDIFDRFSQASQSPDVRVQGTGLGLAICREIAQLLHGAIEVKSKPGEGTTFTVNLRLPIVEQPQNSMSATILKPGQTEMHGPAPIMLVSQNSGVACEIRNKLQRRGYHINQVAGYTQALDGIRKGHTGPVIANLDQNQEVAPDMRAFLTEARQQHIKTIGISDTPASLDHNLTALVEVLVITPGPWDDLLRELAFATIDAEAKISDAA